VQKNVMTLCNDFLTCADIIMQHDNTRSVPVGWLEIRISACCYIHAKLSGSLLWIWSDFLFSSSSSSQQLYELNSPPPPNLGARSTMAPSSLRNFILLLFLLGYIDKIINELYLSETLFDYILLLVCYAMDIIFM
jgi:hypothetical protein